VTSDVQWIPFPDDRFQVCGLHWFPGNAPELWRLPGVAMEEIPERVASLARYPGGGRVRFASTTSTVRLRVAPGHSRSIGSPLCTGGVDGYVDGVYWASAQVPETEPAEIEVFAGAHRRHKQITLYLPLYRETRIDAIGVDPDADFGLPEPFARELPMVLYGSSLAQGATTARPGLTYQAILARSLDLDFVNLGFGGAGKAEPEVVRRVVEIDACCYVLDLGKSYGLQPAEAYGNMLDALRQAHPAAPIICVTPIFSTREFYSADYTDLSEHTRRVATEATRERIERGDADLHLVHGPRLIGPADTEAYYEGTHLNALGSRCMADRLEPVLRSALGMAPPQEREDA